MAIEPLARIIWANPTTGERGQGGWIDYSLAKAWLMHCRPMFPGLVHWMEMQDVPSVGGG